ncbi:hypothetical protein RIF29_25098 [Crotalaria pallida]|uniref:Uncharacterized protein n=1 Tax=Crotalaria pallida TaxID=3830 RepID=A0AAN9EN59_CROPI
MSKEESVQYDHMSIVEEMYLAILQLLLWTTVEFAVEIVQEYPVDFLQKTFFSFARCCLVSLMHKDHFLLTVRHILTMTVLFVEEVIGIGYGYGDWAVE